MSKTCASLPPRSLLKDFVRIYPFQPSTAYWRWFEADLILRSNPPRGFGLDLGCGDGQLSQLLADQLGNWQLVGIEPDPEELGLAKSCEVYKRLHLAPGDRIPEADNTFDFVFSNSVLEHIPDVRPVLKEACRLLKPGGEALLTVPSGEFRECLGGPSLWWRVLFRQSRQEYLEEFDRRIAVCFYWSDEQWKQTLESAGFCDIRIEHCLEKSVIRRWESIANMTSGILYKLMGGRSRPIEAQRKLGMRKAGQRTPSLLTVPVSALIALAARKDPGSPPRYGNLLIRARKRV